MASIVYISCKQVDVRTQAKILTLTPTNLVLKLTIVTNSYFDPTGGVYRAKHASKGTGDLPM